MIWTGKLIPRKRYITENQILVPRDHFFFLYTIVNLPNFDDTPAEPKIKKLVQPGNNKKYENI